jgi:alanyl-tRNA synthetase
MAEESGFQVNDDDFNKEMEKARTKAKASWKGKAMSIDEAHKIQMAQEVLHTSGATQFKGYEGLTASAKVLRLSDGHAGATQIQQGQDGLLVTDATPFYAEGGGQVGDQGEIKTASGSAIVHNTTKVNDIFLHHIEVTSGVIQAGSDAKLVVNESLRRQTMSNHSATHLTHSALRKVLGSHVTQAGSSVDAEKTRFDFTHNKPLTPEELEKVEDLVNEQISLALPVSAQVMGHKEALQKGAMALFGEKYGDQVRVLTMGDFSCELCGGTHVSNTAQIRLFKIVAESGVSAGVRRIEALTGRGALEYLNKHLSENQKARGLAGIQESWMQFLQSSVSVSDVLEKRREEIKVLEKEIRQLKGSQIDLEQILSRSQKILAGSAQLIVADVSIDDRDVLAQLADQLKNRIQSGVVVVLGQSSADSHPLIVSVTKDLNPKVSAGNLLKEAAQQMGGRGGGRPDFAQGAVPNRGELPKALEKLTSLLK